jgi:tetratricopeptide (TPR) repeat protein
VTIDARDSRPLRDARAAEAYALYLKGKVALDSFNTNSLAEAQSAFQQALALDPTLLAAAEGMALTWRQRGIDENDITALEGWNQARAAAEKVRAIDANSVAAHDVLGMVAAMRDFDWPTSDAELKKALTTNPNDQEAIIDHAQLLAARGHFEGAVGRLNAALALDPLNSVAWQVLGIVLYLNRDHVAATSALRKSLAINPKIDYTHYLLGVIQLLDGHSEEATKEFLAEEEADNRDAGLALVNHALGKQAESDAALARLMREGTEIWPYGLATTYAYRGEKNKAFEWLEKAYFARDSDLVTSVLADPLLALLHDDPRWLVFLRKINLPEPPRHDSS